MTSACFAVLQDPYVRKTGAVAVAKLYDISPAMVKEMGFISKLRDLICDGNPAVSAPLSWLRVSSAQKMTTHPLVPRRWWRTALLLCPKFKTPPLETCLKSLQLCFKNCWPPSLSALSGDK